MDIKIEKVRNKSIPKMLLVGNAFTIFALMGSILFNKDPNILFSIIPGIIVFSVDIACLLD